MTLTPTFARRVLAAAAGLALVAALAGCVSLFPKAKPAQLYRFTPQMTATQSPDGSRIPISLSAVDFTAGAAGDRMLTMSGDEAAYIEGARWVSTAQSQFEEAVDKAFEDGAQSTRIVERRQSASAKMVMNLSVETFEARYDNGPKSAPKVVVVVRAQLIRFPDRAVVGEDLFRSEQTAGDNRVSAIVQAYNAAVTAVLKDLTAWTDRKATANATAG
ncbi:MAG TPA: ABC-type transport auxiliary lipoprotein family protein [Caulobacteraceae bacterium]|jgi:cholesterol transport system auxiliary component|nr:ABC-type transport auxiliary lipoprotein family protein [Caulobacteraceae bacterium]